MTESSPNPAKSPLSARIGWIVIWLALILIGAWTVWAGRQPEAHSIWGE
ncbi:MAG: hypothetical protein ABSB15_06125 [Bryobacteraceae bacterium]|jgi:hypothetical protein